MIVSLLLSTVLALSPVEHPTVVTIHEGDLQLEMSLDALNTARAPGDARRNWAEGRRHLLGVYGYTAVVPGGPNSQAPAGWSHGVVFIAGTSDVWEGRHGQRFNRAANDYAARYNATVLELAR
ncbi:hypothetical protein [Brevundimonas sp.]|uniref:hypothetical protein n=1 Tax=Brevundimonas sp. TaxID=1871086 RepID=UPI00391999AE